LTVYRIVQEALTNVLKHGGPAAMASVELSYGNTTLDVKISDTGRGVIADLDGTNTGNGLVGMRERVELSDGTMAAGPQPGGGYVLIAMIPLDSQMRRSRVVSAEQPTPPSSMTITVAVVDDQALMRDAYTMILNVQDDLRVVGDAESGQAGVDLCRRTNPDIVLMDVRMPNMDGIEAAKIICNDPHISTKVLMLTTFDLDEYVYAACELAPTVSYSRTHPPRNSPTPCGSLPKAMPCSHPRSPSVLLKSSRTEPNPTTTKCSSQPTSLNANTNHCNCLPAA
jgi:CheY-like chemotaxis protein